MKLRGRSDEYELACLTETRKLLLDSQALEQDGADVRSVELVDDERGPRIVVALERRGHLRTLEWLLYKDEFSGTMRPGEVESPKGVAMSLFAEAAGTYD
jgi:hypothetical protein